MILLHAGKCLCKSVLLTLGLYLTVVHPRWLALYLLLRWRDRKRRQMFVMSVIKNLEMLISLIMWRISSSIFVKYLSPICFGWMLWHRYYWWKMRGKTFRTRTALSVDIKGCANFTKLQLIVLNLLNLEKSSSDEKI